MSQTDFLNEQSKQIDLNLYFPKIFQLEFSSMGHCGDTDTRVLHTNLIQKCCKPYRFEISNIVDEF